MSSGKQCLAIDLHDQKGWQQPFLCLHWPCPFPRSLFTKNLTFIRRSLTLIMFVLSFTFPLHPQILNVVSFDFVLLPNILGYPLSSPEVSHFLWTGTLYHWAFHGCLLVCRLTPCTCVNCVEFFKMATIPTALWPCNRRTTHTPFFDFVKLWLSF